MQIPLDYYRILGVPIQATDEQLQQAYDDSRSQLPRREYGTFAIASRKLLLDQAYQILSDSAKRSAYEATFLEQNAEKFTLSDPLTEATSTQGIEIQAEQFVGALLILQDLGEYEIVIRLGESYLAQSEPQHSEGRPDIIFTLALAYLELSRERWKQQDYEAAALLSQKGLKWLQKENLFPQLQEEISAEYYKLRPYRIIHCVSEDLAKAKLRSQGLQLLQEMLQERQGIDGQGNDGSGLNSNRFLLYIQQLRPYLTLNEQLSVFETAARPTSAVDACLNVYMLIAKGFSEKKTDCILKATSLLEQLSKYQNVDLEQAMCALLLGQTERANSAAEKIQETDVLNYIKERSENSPDLLPGLYEYTEEWLQTELYPQFRDLIHQPVSLQDYFADENVQQTLEQLSNLGHLGQNFSSPATPKPEKLSSNGNNIQNATDVTFHLSEENDNLIPLTGEPAMRKSALSQYQYLPEPNFPQRGRRTSNSPKRNTRSQGRSSGYADPVVRPPSERQSEPSRYPSPKSSPEKSQSPTAKKSLLKKKTRARRRKFQPLKLFLMIGCLLGGLGLSILAVRAIQDSQSPLSALQGEQLDISLSHPPIELPSANAQEVSPSTLSATTLTSEGAKEVIQTWLNSKVKAFGSEHQIESLKTILAEPLLSDWQKRAIALKNQNSYWQYQHQLNIQSVTTNAKNPNQATVIAKVQETADFNENGKVVKSRSYDQNLSVRYELVRQQEQWLIQNITVLN